MYVYRIGAFWHEFPSAGRVASMIHCMESKRYSTAMEWCFGLHAHQKHRSDAVLPSLEEPEGSRIDCRKHLQRTTGHAPRPSAKRATTNLPKINAHALDTKLEHPGLSSNASAHGTITSKHTKPLSSVLWRRKQRIQNVPPSPPPARILQDNACVTGPQLGCLAKYS